MATRDLSESQATFPSDSENYDANHSSSPEMSDEQTSPSSSPMILYSPPTLWGVLRGAAINLLLPFVNGLMLGFGELFAHEAAYRLGWSKTKVSTMGTRGQAVLRWSRGNRYSACPLTQIYRSSHPIETHMPLDRVWRSETTPLSEEGETAKS